MNNNVYSAPSASLDTTSHTPPTKAGLILKISSVLSTLPTMLVAVAKASLTDPYPGVAVGSAIAPIFLGIDSCWIISIFSSIQKPKITL